MLAFVGLSPDDDLDRRFGEENRFNYAAIVEVAALFIGIFIAMQVPFEVLKAFGPAITETLNQPWHFFWLTGVLSSFLDNAPTYLVFFGLGQTMPGDGGRRWSALVGEAAISASLLAASASARSSWAR